MLRVPSEKDYVYTRCHELNELVYCRHADVISLLMNNFTNTMYVYIIYIDQQRATYLRNLKLAILNCNAGKCVSTNTFNIWSSSGLLQNIVRCCVMRTT